MVRKGKAWFLKMIRYLSYPGFSKRGASWVGETWLFISSSWWLGQAAGDALIQDGRLKRRAPPPEAEGQALTHHVYPHWRV